jgi:hypothetical protein
VVVGIAHRGDLGQREAQVDEPFDADETHQMGHPVLLVAVGATFGFGEQADIVIVPNRAQAGAGEFGDLAGAPGHRHILIDFPA